MIITLTFNGAPIDAFVNYNDLFDWITTHPTRPMNWFFFIHPTHRVAALYDKNSQDPGLKEAFEDHLPVIEIRAGHTKAPLYIPLTSNVDVGYYKKKWCLDYCKYRHYRVTELEDY